MTILLYLINLDLHLTGYAYNPPMMIQSNNPELEAWLREKVDLLRKQESISFDKFSEEETNKAKSFLDEKKSVHIDSFKRHKQRDEMSSMCSNLSEKEFQIFLKKGQSIIFPDEVIFDFYRLYYRWTQYGNPEDKTAFIDYVQKNAEGVEYYFGDRTNYWIPTEIRSLEKSLVNAPATRKALIEDVIRELKNRE